MSDRSEGLSKVIFIIAIAVMCLGGTFMYGVFAQKNALPPVPQLRAANQALLQLIKPEEVYHPRVHHLQPSRGQGDGVVVNAAEDDGTLIAMAGFFDEENQIRLVERDGTVVRKWSLDYFREFPDIATRPCPRDNALLMDTHGLYLTPQGDVLYNYDYCGTVRLTQCGDISWTLEEPTHHTLTPSERGGFWISGRWVWSSKGEPDRFPPFSTAARADRQILDDTIMRVSETGDILEEYSFSQIIRDNDLEAMVTAYGQLNGVRRRNELVHINKIEELPEADADAYPLFEAGDLAVSMRGLNLVMVFDPDTKIIKWHQMGPWLRQHDPEFRPDGRISIFNNNIYETAYRQNQTILSTPFTTNIMVIDPVTRATEVVFGEQPGEEMLSVIRGQHELLDDNGILITEFDAGRVLEVNGDREVVWEYVNRYDDEFVGEITNALLFKPGYFETDWPSCN